MPSDDSASTIATPNATPSTRPSNEPKIAMISDS